MLLTHSNSMPKYLHNKKLFLNKGLQYWLPYYLLQHLSPKEKPDLSKPIHIFLCIVDHFEPFNGPVDYNTALKRVLIWKKKYPKFADRHRDSDGKSIQHTWFYPPHLDHRLLPYLVELCQEGHGDIELHLHHNLMEPFPDTSETLRAKILQCIDDYGKYGIFSQPDAKPRFAFIHGDWSLDNSAGDRICGVNDELTILQECGCYADFTFPCLTQAQPAMVNQIYYAIDDPIRAKSYNRGIPVRVGAEVPTDSLMIIQGIIGLRPDNQKSLKFAIDYSDLDFRDTPMPSRIDYWVKNSISIKGRPNWRFIKLHTHGGREIRFDANFGDSADIAFGYMEEKYNDGKNYLLHYVTSREMYNIIKAVEGGFHKELGKVRDLVIKPYGYS